MTDDETMTTSQVQQLLHLASPAAARVQITTRWKLTAVGRDTQTGEKLWRVADIRQRLDERAAAKQRRTGQAEAGSG